MSLIFELQIKDFVLIFVGTLASLWPAILVARRYGIKVDISHMMVTEFIAFKRQPVGDLKISFKGTDVERLFLTKIYVWNSGNAIIREADLDTADPLRLQLTGEEKVFNIFIARATTSAIGANIEFRNENSRILFKFLEKGDGFRIDVVHSGVSAILKGRIIGIREGMEKKYRRKRSRYEEFLYRHFLYGRRALGNLVAVSMIAGATSGIAFVADYLLIAEKIYEKTAFVTLSNLRSLYFVPLMIFASIFFVSIFYVFWRENFPSKYPSLLDAESSA